MDSAQTKAVSVLSRATQSTDAPRWRPVVFSDVGDWPDLGQYFADKAHAISRTEGPIALQQAGVVPAGCGRWTFGPASSVAAYILSEFARHPRGFLYRDSSQENWAISVEELPEDNFRWRGLAIGGYFTPRILSPFYRAEQLNRIEEQLDAFKAKVPEAGSPAAKHRQQLPAEKAKLEAINLGMFVMPMFYSLATSSGSLSVRADLEHLAEYAYGSNTGTWPEEWPDRIRHSLSLLTTAFVQVFDLPKSGWAPRCMRRDPVIRTVVHAQDRIGITLARPFMELLRRWIDPCHADAFPFDAKSRQKKRQARKSR